MKRDSEKQQSFNKKGRVSDTVDKKNKGSLLKCFERAKEVAYEKTFEAKRVLEVFSENSTGHSSGLVDDLQCDLEKCMENYLESWGEKCKTNSTNRTLMKEQVDLDRHGIKFVNSVRHFSEHAYSIGMEVPKELLEQLVLVMRNDVVHQYSHVSRAAYECLMELLEKRPYAVVEHEDNNEICFVNVRCDAAWLPFFK